MNLILDQGNTNLKIYFFCKNKIEEKFIFPIENFDLSFILKDKVEHIIYSTVSGIDNYFFNYFNDKKITTFNLSTPLPIINKYEAKTIGLDRLAGVSGASEIFPETNVLVIDIGSAITYDLITKNKEFLGGNISPGLKLRYKSLNNYTVNLPLIEPEDIDYNIGKTTEQAIRAGVQKGILYEIESYINDLSKDYENLRIILTGGDADFFAKKIKYSIFAEPNLVAIGLNKILNYNIEEQI
ncbi:MAG: type III pantothenate kinase [Bacteroidales bacterium]|nr:type III pantothenate kinase [Bacteroidales bacterium]